MSQYRFPSWPFGPPPNYTGTPYTEPGAEELYTMQIASPAVNFGVSVLAQSASSEIDPFVLGSKDENDVQGYAGLPVNVNGLMFDYRADIESAGAAFPLPKRYYVAVDSGQRRVHRQVAARQVRAARLGRRSSPALAQARHDASSPRAGRRSSRS